jgi:hypothetical protein
VVKPAGITPTIVGLALQRHAAADGVRVGVERASASLRITAAVRRRDLRPP